MKYKIADLVEFRDGHPNWVQHDKYSDRWVSWKVHESINHIRIDVKYALVCGIEEVGEGSNKTFYHVMYNDLYCLVREDDILRKIN